MRSILLFSLLFILSSYLFAQTELTLDNLTSVNAQIEADRAGASPADVYIAPSGAILWWDATLQVDFDLVIRGASSDWIGKQTSPAVFVPIPDAGGAVYAFAHATSGSITLENILMSGENASEGGTILGGFLTEAGATEMILDNCAFADMGGNVLTIDSAPELVSITNCLMINSHNLSDRPWGGHFGRFNVPAALTVMENNTYVNHGRLLGNGGNFYNSDLIENHITSVNCQTNAQNLHWRQALMANNIFVNWSWMGRTPADVAYNYSITTFETFAGLELDSVSLYFGTNLLYRDPAIKEYYDTELAAAGATVLPYICWNLDVDSTITADDDFTIGKNYWDIDPVFTTGPDNLDAILGWLLFKYDANVTEWVDWRVTSPVSYDAGGQPVISWPPDFDLSYSRPYLQTAGTDGLPVGDLNWFPDAKATYLANREAYIAALQDSIHLAERVYLPGDSLSNRITIDMLSVEDFINGPSEFGLSQNYPNPFNPTTTFAFKMDKADDISMKVYDITGQLVKTVIDNKNYTAGAHKVTIDMSKHSSGVYFTVLESGSQKLTRKMMLIK